jgi:epoxyqueuosine reductase
VSLVEWLTHDGDELVREFDRLFVPRNDARYLRRNALVALGNTGVRADADVLAPYLDSGDDLLREHAQWAAAKLEARA